MSKVYKAGYNFALHGLKTKVVTPMALETSIDLDSEFDKGIKDAIEDAIALGIGIVDDREK